MKYFVSHQSGYRYLAILSRRIGLRLINLMMVCSLVLPNLMLSVTPGQAAGLRSVAREDSTAETAKVFTSPQRAGIKGKPLGDELFAPQMQTSFETETGGTSRVSINNQWQAGDNVSGRLPDWREGSLSLSGDGRYVVFVSDAANLVNGDGNGQMDVFMHDLFTGETRRVSMGADGGETTHWNDMPDISANGQRVVFRANDPLLPAVDNAWEDVYAYDVVSETLMLVSQPEDGGGCWSGFPSISDDGNRVAFSSCTDGMMSGISGAQVYLRDLQSNQIELINVNNAGEAGITTVSDPQPFISAISSDGRYVAFESDSYNLVISDTNQSRDIFVRDTLNDTTILVSLASGDSPGNGESVFPAISGDGRYVAFSSEADNLVSDDNNARHDIFLRDLISGTTSLISQGWDGPADGPSTTPDISADGRYVAYVSSASNLVQGDDNGADDIFVYDRVTGETHLLSVNSQEDPADSGSWDVAISGDGQVVVFVSDATNLVTDDTEGYRDVFVRRRTLSPTPAPVNDDANLAIEITSLPFRHVVNTTSATTNTNGNGDPWIECGGISSTHANSVWYRYSPTENGQIRISLPGSDYDTILAVWEGDVVDSWSPVGCETDAELPGTSLTATAWVGETYWLEVVQKDVPEGGIARILVEAVDTNNYDGSAVNVGEPVNVDGIFTAPITVTLQNAIGQPVSGTVALQVSGSYNWVNGVPALPDEWVNLGSGESFTAVLTSTVAETKTISVQVGGIMLAASANVTFPAQEAAQLLALWPGETLRPGSAPGKTGPREETQVEQEMELTVLAVDANWNVVADFTGDVYLYASDDIEWYTVDGPYSGWLTLQNGQGQLTLTAWNLGEQWLELDSPDLDIILTENFTVVPLRLDGTTITASTPAPDANSRLVSQVTVELANAYGTPVYGDAWVQVSGSHNWVGNESVLPDTWVYLGNDSSFAFDLASTLAETKTVALRVGDQVLAVTAEVDFPAQDASGWRLLLPGQASTPGEAPGKSGVSEPISAGEITPLTLQVVDVNWNVVDLSWENLVISTTDPLAALPGPVQLVTGEAVAYVTWGTPGTQTITVTTENPDFAWLGVLTETITVANALPPGQLRADYYANTTLTPPIALTRYGQPVDFDLTNGEPIPGISDDFSIRWSGQLIAPRSETYTFHVTADDGVRLWLNGQLLVDAWASLGLSAYTTTAALVAGQPNDFRLEYYQNSDDAVVRLEWESAGTPRQVIPLNRFNYPDWASSTIQAAPLALPANGVTTTTLSILLADSLGQPLAGRPLYAQVTGGQNRIAGIDILPGSWIALGDTDTSGLLSAALSSSEVGEKFISVRVGDVFVGVVSVTFTPAPIAGLRGEYFSGTTLAGEPVYFHYGEVVDFTWDYGGPEGLDPNSFSVRWSGQLLPPVTGLYTFSTFADDGEILWIGETRVITDWVSHGAVLYNGTIHLVAGQAVPILLEYFESGGLANAQLSWRLPGESTAQIIPLEYLSCLDTTASSIVTSEPQDATGLPTSLVTVTLASEQGYAYTGMPVYLQVSGSQNSINDLPADGQWVLLGNSDAQGVITATLSSTLSESKLLRVRADGILLDQTATVVFPVQPPAGILALLAGETATPGSAPGKVGTPEAIYARQPVSITLQVVDGFWNRLTGFSGEFTLATSDPAASLPLTATITNGQVNIIGNWQTAGSQVLTATLTGDPSLTAVINLDVLDTLVVASGQTVTVDDQRYAMTEVITAGMASLPYPGGLGLLPGHEILVITMLGDGIGTHITATIQSIENGRLVLTAPLGNDFDGRDDKVMVQRVPHYPNVIVENGGTLTVHAWDGNTGGVLFLRATNITIENGGVIDVSGLGFERLEGPGSGKYASSRASGGGHGGYGASMDRISGGLAYGSLMQPLSLGSAGGTPYLGHVRGGGVIRLSISGWLQVNGSILADGETSSAYYAGGGAGGSIWLDVAELRGTGTIRANGGNGQYENVSEYASGAGGRIAIYAAERSGFSSGTWQAAGGSVGADGSSGTIFLQDTTTSANRILVDNLGRVGYAAVVSNTVGIDWSVTTIELRRNGSLEFASPMLSIVLNPTLMAGDGSAQLMVHGSVTYTASELTSFGFYAYPGATLALPTDLTVHGVKLTNEGILSGLQNLTLAANGSLTSTVGLSALGHSDGQLVGTYALGNVIVGAGHSLEMPGDPATGRGVTLLAENVTVATGGRISADGMGYNQPNFPGIGAGSSISSTYGGGGHGGYGGGVNGGGQPYGLLLQPASLGSAGSASSSSSGQNRNAGGGAIRLIVSGSLLLDGTLSANGARSFSVGGGGAGGSIWVTTQEWAGTGIVSVNGGAAYSSSDTYGGGSGGRIAVYVATDDFSGTLQAFGSLLGADGSPGTIYLENTNDGSNKLLVDGNNASARPAVVTAPGTQNWTFGEIKLLRKGNLLFLDAADNVNLSSTLFSGDYSAQVFAYGGVDLSNQAELRSSGLHIYSTGTLTVSQNLTVRGVNLTSYGELRNAVALTIVANGAYKGSVRLGASGHSSGQPAGSYIFDQVIIQSGQMLETESNTVSGQGVTFIANTLSIANGAVFSADGLGYSGTDGTGNGPGGAMGCPAPKYYYRCSGSGGGHAGQGGGSSFNGEDRGGTAYGDVFYPTQPGSAGGFGYYSINPYPGGNGGGAIHLVISDTLTVSGTLSANGVSQSYGGAGAGGSLWLDVDHLLGNGLISANGGSSNSGSGNGGGSGGRIAVYAISDDFNGTWQAFGGQSTYDGFLYHGAPGTIYRQNMTTGWDSILVNGNNLSARPAVITSSGPVIWNFDLVSMPNRGSLEILDTNDTIILTESNMAGDGTGQLFLNAPLTYTLAQLQYFGLAMSPGMTLTLPADFTVLGTKLTTDGPVTGVVTLTLAANGSNNSLVRLSALGHSAGQPAGTYAFTNVTVNAGQTLELAGDPLSGRGVTILADSFTVAGHISADGMGYTAAQNGLYAPGDDTSGASHGGIGGGTQPGATFGERRTPTTLGSAGRNIGVAANGGGAIYLLVDGILNIPAGGSITANGKNATGSYGAGAGGSVWISAATISGSGAIRALGGNASAGSGGGGRIAIYASVIDPALVISAARGSGASVGGDGSVYLNELDPAFSTIEVSPVVMATELGSVGVITVTLVDTDTLPLAGKPVSVRLSSGSQVFINGNSATNATAVVLGQTNAQGVITATISATTPGVRELQAFSGQNVVQRLAMVTFIVGSINADTSEVSPSGSDHAPADGNSTLAVRVIVRDGYGNPISGIPVTLDPSGSATVMNGIANTNAYGITYGYILNSINEVVTVTASAGGVGLLDTATLSFSGADLRTEITAIAPDNNGQSTTRSLAGFPITYTLTVRNVGLMPAEGVVVTDTFPAGVSYLYHNSAYTATLNGDAVSWQVGTLAAGAQTSIQVVASIDGLVLGTIHNQVTASTISREDGYANNPSGLATLVDVYVPKLAVTPSMPTIRLAPGSTTVFTATIRNNNVAEITGLAVTQPGFVTWITASTPTVSSLAPNQGTVITITISVPASQTLGYYRDRIIIRENSGRKAAIALTVRVVGETRPLAVSVHNDQGQMVTNASIQLIKQIPSLSITEGNQETYYPHAEASTSLSGTLQLTDLEVGTYDYLVQAADHQAVTGTVVIIPGNGSQNLSLNLPALPRLRVSPSSPQIDVVAGGRGSVAISVSNLGQAPLRGLAIVPPTQIAWVYLGVPSPLPELLPGEGISFTVYANPPLTETTGIYQDTFLVNGLDGQQASIPLVVNVTADATRDVQVQLLNAQGQPISDTTGTVLLTQQKQSILQLPDGRKLSYNPQVSLPIDENGMVTFSNLEAGNYNYQIFPDAGYQEMQGMLNLPNGGGTFNQPLTLEDDPIQYSWTVEPIGGDEYNISLSLTYDSNSNKPGLLISPQVICEGEWDEVTIVNPTDIELYPTGGSAGLSGVLEPHQMVSLPVFGDQVGSKEIRVDFNYFVAAGEALPFTLNPSSSTSPQYTSGVTYVRPLRLDFPAEPYPFDLIQPANTWISVTQVLTESKAIFFQLGVALDPYLPEGEYDDVATFIFRGNGSTRTGYLHIEVTKNANGWQAHTWLELGQIAYTTDSGSSSAKVTIQRCVAGSGSRVVPRYFNESSRTLVLDYTGEGFIPGVPPPPLGNDHQQVRLQLSQKAVVENENFNAHLSLSNIGSQTMSDVTVEILMLATDGANQAFNFNLAAKSFDEIAAGSSVNMDWLVLPNALNVTALDGEEFAAIAVVSYTWDGEQHSFATVPEYIRVYPSPSLSIRYALPYPSDPCKVFDLKATVRNAGPGAARGLSLTKPNIQIADNQSGMALNFRITSVTINGASVPSSSWAALNLGALPPDSEAVVVWRLETNIAGRFVEFASDHRQTNYAEQAWQSPMKIETYLVPGTCGAVPDDSTFCSGDDFCLGSIYQGSQGSAGGPINTRTGGYDYSASDLSIPTLAGTLEFKRWYASQTTDIYTTTLGYGWTHNLDSRLIFPEDPGGQEGKVFFKAHSANLYEFYITGDGLYQPYPGMCGSLVRTPEAPYTYTIKDGSQRTYTFDALGRLVKYNAPNGYSLHYEYIPHPQPLSQGKRGVLARVSDDTGTRFLILGYDSQGRIVSVTDHTGRQVQYEYDLATGDLITVTDVLAQPWTYTYDPAHPHFISTVLDPRGTTIEHTEYDTRGRAVRQYNGAGELVVELTYHANGQVTVRDGRDNSQTHTYDSHNTLTGVTNALANTSGKTYDENFRPEAIITPWGNGETSTQNLDWSADGENLDAYTDALGNATRMEYDAQNNLIAVTDSLTNTTRYVYGNADGTPGGSLLLRSTDALGQTTYYTYTTAADWPQPANLLKLTRGPEGSTTHYQYDAYGQQIAVINSLGLATHFTYDDLGRLITTEDSNGRTNWACYDNAGRVVRSVSNASGDGSTPQTDPCDAAHYVPSTDRSYDRINSTQYDAVGNVIATTDSNGIVTRTYYDQADRSTHTVRNLSDYAVSNPVPLPAALIGVDENLLSQTIYDSASNVIASIEWARLGSEVVSTTTRTYYDALNRPEYVVRNLQGWAIENDTPPPADLRTPNSNLTSQTVYDVAGNVTRTIDPAGRVNHTCYDKNQRVIKTIQNPSVADPCLEYTPVTDPDMDVIQRTYYDANGNMIATVDTQGVTTRSYYDALGRATLVIRNLTAQRYTVNTPPPSSAYGNDENIATQTAYDDTGAAIASIEWLVVGGQVVSHTTRTYYDSHQRPYLVIRNLTYQSYTVNTPPPQTAFGNDENIASGTLYDSEGRSIASRQWLVVDGALVFQTSRTYYDSLERPYLSLRNLNPTYNVYTTTPPACNRDGSQGEYNLCSETLYDAEGRAMASVDVIGRVTLTYFDDLGRSVTTVRNLDTANHPVSLDTPPIPDANDPDHNLRSDTVYDGRGQAVAQIEWLALDGVVVTRTRRTYSDALGRTTVSVQNLDPAHGILNPVPPACNRGQDDSLYNLCMETTYGPGGQAIATTDVQGVVTRPYFDRLGRTVAVVRNLTGDVFAATWPAYDPVHPDRNVRHEQVYDRSGNVILETDVLSEAERISTRYEYDVLGRLRAVVENYQPTEPTNAETNVRTEYTYDALGNRLTIRDGNAHFTYFLYDALGRMISETDALGHTWQYGYDALGRQISKTDPSTGSGQAPNEQTTRFVYDSLGRLQQIDYPSTGSGQVPSTDDNVFYQYNVLGWRQAMTDSVGLTTWAYDDLGRALTVTDPFTGTVGYAYDLTGNRLSLTYPNQEVITYTYDILGRMTAVGGLPEAATTYEYSLVGQVLTTTLPNGVVTTNHYDRLGRLLTIQHRSVALTLAEYQYTYDGRGNRIQAVENVRVIATDTPTPTATATPTETPTPTATDTTTPTATPTAPVPNQVIVTVLDTNGDPASGLAVYAFNDASYTGYSKTTDANGQATFTLPLGSYRFRADKNGTQFWSGTANHCSLPGCTAANVTLTLPVTVTVLDTDGAAQPGLPVYAFNGVTYTGYNSVTNAQGQVTLTLPQGEYRFRADQNGIQFWSGTSNHCTLPGCGMAEITTTIPLTITVLDTDGAAQAGLTVYAFDGSMYTGYSKVSNADGQAAFTLPQGSYRFRADKNGTQFWSSTSNHCTLPGCTGATITTTVPLTVTVVDTDGIAQAGLSVYAFDGATYTGYSKATDANGQAIFTLPQGNYRFRSDKNGTPFWSGTSGSSANHCTLPGCSDATITVTGVLVVTVIDTYGTPQDGLTVYVYDGTTYTGYTATSNNEGQVSFTLPQGNYRFRTDRNSTQFWSGSSNHCTVPGCSSASITVTASLLVTVSDTDGSSQAGLTVYAFDGSTYTNYSKTTDANGQAEFILPQGSYRFRADKNGTQFWSGAANHCTIPGCTQAAITVTLPVVVSVLDTNGLAQVGLTVYAFNGTTYTGYSKTTDANGQASFTLPQGGYRFRADKNGTQFWSGTNGSSTNHCTLPGCTSAAITVTSALVVTVLDTDGTVQAGLTVYAFNDASYTGYSKTTNANGQATFTLPLGNYRFRADKNGTQFWSGTANHCTLPGCTGASVTVTKPLIVSVTDTSGAAQAGLTVYAFNETTYTGYNKTTDTNGQATFTLPIGSYRFRADRSGQQYWSDTTNHCALPGCTAVNITLPVVVGMSKAPGLARLVSPNQESVFTNQQTTLVSTTINYTYDPLGRLTDADYSNGISFSYTYDAVGNRLTQEVCTDILCTPTAYDYDDANRLIQAGSTAYTWDDNGNLLNDGEYTYTYSRANRLVSASGNGVTVSYAYNGNGDRLGQTVNGVITHFTLDLNTGLTQVLADGENIYLYGRGRIAEIDGTTAEYYLGDALGSVRQLVNDSEIVFSRNYMPFGENQSSGGEGATSYGFTSEWTEPTGQIFLRARYYSPAMGRFLTRDTWDGSASQPISYNRWAYANANPINLVDSSGRNPNCWPLFSDCAAERFNEIVNIDTATAHKNALTLIALFDDEELGALGDKFPWHNPAGDNVEDRLVWILHMTYGYEGRGIIAFISDKCVKFLELPMQFGRDTDFGSDDHYFKEELRDNQFYNQAYWSKANKPSNQVGHFLSAVSLAYNWPDFTAVWLDLAHELRSDNSEDPNGGMGAQLTVEVTSQMKQDFADAISADEIGDSTTRDQLLWGILGFPESVAFGDVDPLRQGNSLQDLRLTVRGYRFGKWVRNNQYLLASKGATWLRENILYP